MFDCPCFQAEVAPIGLNVFSPIGIKRRPSWTSAEVTLKALRKECRVQMMFWERGIRQQRKYEMAEREGSLRSALIRAAVAAVSLSFAILEKTL